MVDEANWRPSDERMVNTGVLTDHQGKGVYTRMLPVLMDRVRREGFQIMFSRHRAASNRVIVPKLEAGFVISGFETSDVFGLLVQFSYYPNPDRRRAMDVWTGELAADARMRELGI